jgi:hypothetical protein
MPGRAATPKQEQVPIFRQVLAKVTKADDLEVHTCKARLDGVVVLDIRDYIPSTKTYGRGTTLPWNTETLKVLEAALREARRG